MMRRALVYLAPCAGLVAVLALAASAPRTTLVTVNAARTDSGNGGSSFPRLSANGRFIAFESVASDLVATDTNGTTDVFVRDLRTGHTTLVSVNAAGTDGGNSGSGFPRLSPNGRFVAFQSDANDLVATDTMGARDIFVRDLGKGRR